MGKEKPTQLLLPYPNDNSIIIIEETKERSIPSQKVLSTKNNQDQELVKNNQITSSKNEVLSVPKQFLYFSKDEQLLFTHTYNSLAVNKTLSSKPHNEIVKYRQKKKENVPYYIKEAKLKINSSSGVIIPETLPFIDSLFKALEKVGAKINITTDDNQILFKGNIYILNFRLPSNKITLSPGDKEYSTYNTFKFVPTGNLNVEVGYLLEWHRWSKHEKLIKQNKSDTIDDLLKKVFLYIFSLPEKIDMEEKNHKITEEKKRKEEEQKALLKKQHENEYKRTEELLNKSIHYFYSQLVKNYIESELEETTEEYNWAMNKSNWIKDSDKYLDSILSIRDKERLIDLKSSKGFI
ncbi:hypothetical protein PGC35_14225 [Psychrobacillus sp. PGGUH221]|uniref:hypothetical protein n=1 Tax=Psychrobacillus sp. PGGUH221 TaxID=3020058 RepID=UPI0035C68D56